MKKCIICGEEKDDSLFVGGFCKKCFDKIKECCVCGDSSEVNFKQDGKYYCEDCFYKKHDIIKEERTRYVFYCGGDYVGDTHDKTIQEILDNCCVGKFEYRDYGFDFDDEEVSDETD